MSEYIDCTWPSTLVFRGLKQPVVCVTKRLPHHLSDLDRCAAGNTWPTNVSKPAEGVKEDVQRLAQYNPKP
jgi:hypothetical protein